MIASLESEKNVIQNEQISGVISNTEKETRKNMRIQSKNMIKFNAYFEIECETFFSLFRISDFSRICVSAIMYCIRKFIC